MHKSVLSVLLALFAMGGGLALNAAAKKVSKSPRSSSVTARKTTAKAGKPSSRKTVASSSKKRGKASARTASSRRSKSRRSTVRSARRSYQQSPTPERFREIQEALASRGYFQGEVNGAWGADSVAALKRFQKEQNLNPDGKLDSLSLIALGLGPKRSLTARTAPDTKMSEVTR